MFTRFALFILKLLHHLPLATLAKMGNALGSLMYVFAAKRKHIARVNLSLCFPQLSESEREDLVKKNFQVFIRALLERSILWWAPLPRILQMIRVEGLEHYTAAQHNPDDPSKHRPVILLAPHFVALDVAGVWISQYQDVVSVYAKQRNPVFHEQLLAGRKRFGNPVLVARTDGLRPIVKALRKGHAFYYLPDQDWGIKNGLFVPFFGVQAATISTLPRLCDMADAVVVPITTKMLPNGEGYVVKFYPAWENYPTGDTLADTRRMNEFIEQATLDMPEQYFWLHRRFKTRPEGEKKVY